MPPAAVVRAIGRMAECICKHMDQMTVSCRADVLRAVLATLHAAYGAEGCPACGLGCCVGRPGRRDEEAQTTAAAAAAQPVTPATAAAAPAAPQPPSASER